MKDFSIEHLSSKIVESTQFLQNVLNSLDPVCILDESLRLFYTNVSFISISGYSADEIIGESFRIFLYDSSWILLKNEITKKNKENKINDVVLEFIDKRKKGFTANIRINFFEYQGSLFTILSLEDITERVLSEYNLFLKEETLIKKNELFVRELLYAKRIIQKLIPGKVQRVDYLDIEYCFMPLETIGGDLFFFRKLNARNFGVFIGDVTGHGISAALFLTLVKAFSNRLLPKYGLKPHIFMQELNRELSFNMDSYFLTAIYSVFSVGKNEVIFKFARGGHPPPFIIRKSNKTVETVSIDGKPVGVMDELRYSYKKVLLDNGDRVVLYTDGILEIKNTENMTLGLQGFKSIIEKYKDLNIEQCKRKTIDDLNKFKGTNGFEDDIVLIIVEVKIHA